MHAAIAAATGNTLPILTCCAAQHFTPCTHKGLSSTTGVCCAEQCYAPCNVSLLEARCSKQTNHDWNKQELSREGGGGELKGKGQMGQQQQEVAPVGSAGAER